jgi:hypothetical protein
MRPALEPLFPSALHDGVYMASAAGATARFRRLMPKFSAPATASYEAYGEFEGHDMEGKSECNKFSVPCKNVAFRFFVLRVGFEFKVLVS